MQIIFSILIAFRLLNVIASVVEDKISKIGKIAALQGDKCATSKIMKASKRIIVQKRVLLQELLLIQSKFSILNLGSTL